MVLICFVYFEIIISYLSEQNGVSEQSVLREVEKMGYKKIFALTRIG